MLAAYILPWFGGGPSIWTACLLFFQVVLLAGYAYAHGISRLQVRHQVVVHLSLLAVSLFTLPITPSVGWQPEDVGFPAFRILGLLVVSVGAPYFLLSSTSPLLQSWITREGQGDNAYRLYAVSNAASFLGLLAYPFFVEPTFARTVQTVGWSFGYGLTVVAIAVVAIALLRKAKAAASETDDTPLPGWKRQALWFVLAATASVMLLGLTNEITYDIAPVPFLWVIPLALYLLTFVLAFERPRWYSRPVFGIAFAAFLLLHSDFAGLFFDIPSAAKIVIACGTLFTGCMICHGEVYRLRPSPRHLTRYYLILSGGGATGGLFVALIAPVLFNRFWETPFSLALTFFLLLALVWKDQASPLFKGAMPKRWGIIAAVFWVCVLGQFMRMGRSLSAVDGERNFYGVLLVEDVNNGTFRELHHGSTTHGAQFLDEERRRWPTTYFGQAGVEHAFEQHPARLEGRPLRVGVVGLGIGTQATWGREADRFVYYEINPASADFAQEYFTFLEDSRADVHVVLGDGRLELEATSEKFDLIVIDAFSGGWVPVHLLTAEAFQIYDQVLDGDGIIALNISNAHLNLAPVVQHGANALGASAFLSLDSSGNEERGQIPSAWAFVTRNEAWAQHPLLRPIDFPPVAWTDEHASLFDVVVW